MKIHISSDAETDIVDGFWFHEHREAGLGDYFRSSVVSDIDSLSIHGGIHRIVHGYYRSLCKMFFLGFFSAVMLPLASAQPLCLTHTTIEAQIASADSVVLATIADFSLKTIVGRGGKSPEDYTDSNGRDEYTITLNVKEVFKGNVADHVSNLRPINTLGVDERIEQWKTSKAEFLCFLGPAPESSGTRNWNYRRVSPPVEAEKLFGGKNELGPMLGQDLALLKTDEEILERARAFGPTSEQVKISGGPPTVWIRPPSFIFRGLAGGDYLTLVLPVNTSLEKLALQLIRSPEKFLKRYQNSKNLPFREKRESAARYQLTINGIQCLRFFKSDSNIELLKGLLNKDPNVLGLGTGFKSIRHQALEVLMGWGTELELPEFWESITELDLARSQANDPTMRLVGKLKNLRTLQLTNADVTSKGLRYLNGMANLTTIEIADEHLTDSVVHALHAVGLLHALSQATRVGREFEFERPRSAAEVGSLSLWGSPISDRGLAEFHDFENVVWIDLRDTEITDDGLDELFHMTKLKNLSLDDLKLTDSGINKLVRFQQLETVGLENHSITDVSLEVLSTIASLKYIRLSGTPVTAEGVRKFKESLPNCKIVSPSIE